MELRLRQEIVRPGDTVEFEVTKTSNSKTALGCKNVGDTTLLGRRMASRCVDRKRLLQNVFNNARLGQFSRGTRHDVQNGTRMGNDELDFDLHPGRYRIVLVDTSLYLATDFTIFDAA